MTVTRPEFPAPVIVLDDFLAPEDAAACLQECFALEYVYQPATVGAGAENCIDPKTRINEVVMLDDVFRAAPQRSKILSIVKRRIYERDCTDLWHDGYLLFDDVNYATRHEAVLSRYGRCDFYKAHQDIIRDKNRPESVRYRIVTLVVYFNEEPERFIGGALTLYEKGQTLTLEPRHNRAVMFPSFTVHEVGKVTVVDENDFRGSRFSLNWWMGFY
jgi:hypothetical protein